MAKRISSCAAEVNPLGDTSGGYSSALDWVALAARHFADATCRTTKPAIGLGSAIQMERKTVDLIVTDPPYYDAIPYSDLMDFFYVWLRRSMKRTMPLRSTRLFENPCPRNGIQDKKRRRADR